MSETLNKIEDNLTKQVGHIATVSYLEGSISTLDSLKKAYATFGIIGQVPLSLIIDSIDSLKKEQEERLEGIKKLHDQSES